MLPNEIRDLTGEPPTIINRTRGSLFCGYHTVCKRNTVIVVAKGGGLMNDPCTVGVGNICVDKDSESFGLILWNEW